MRHWRRILLRMKWKSGLAAVLLAVFLPGEASPYTVDEPYEYPTVPGTEEWNALPGLKEKIEACHVDTALLESMTQEDYYARMAAAWAVSSTRGFVFRIWS